MPLVVRTDDDMHVMPPRGHRLMPGDQILLRGREPDLRLLDATLHDAYTLGYLVSGVDAPRGYVMRWVARRLGRDRPALDGRVW